MRERAFSILFIVLAVLFLGLTFWLLLVDKTSYGRSGTAFLTAALCMVFGHIHSIASFKATPTSFEAKMREVAEVVDDAKATLKNLHEIAAMTGATLIDINAGKALWLRWIIYRTRHYVRLWQYRLMILLPLPIKWASL
jgi:hypothetical protein